MRPTRPVPPGMPGRGGRRMLLEPSSNCPTRIDSSSPAVSPGDRSVPRSRAAVSDGGVGSTHPSVPLCDEQLRDRESTGLTSSQNLIFVADDHPRPDSTSGVLAHDGHRICVALRGLAMPREALTNPEDDALVMFDEFRNH